MKNYLLFILTLFLISCESLDPDSINTQKHSMIINHSYYVVDGVSNQGDFCTYLLRYVYTNKKTKQYIIRNESEAAIVTLAAPCDAYLHGDTLGLPVIIQ